MRDTHIINLIEGMPFGSLSESDLTTIKAHAAACSACQRAFEAAQVSSLMLKERMVESFEPSPFFHTRVLATLRERQAANETWAWGRIWRATGALASAMVATVAALAVLTFVIPETQVTSQLMETTSARNVYSAEEVILNPGELPDEASDAYVLTTLYDSEDTVE